MRLEGRVAMLVQLGGVGSISAVGIGVLVYRTTAGFHIDAHIGTARLTPLSGKLRARASGPEVSYTLQASPTGMARA